MLDYKLIEALARVVDEGGFNRAAEVLCLTQSAVSQRIRLLEDGCGQILLTRGSPPRATAAGHSLLKHYRQVRLLEDGLDADLQESPTTLSIGLNTDSLASWFLEAIRPLLQSGLLFDLRVDDQEQTHRYLRDGDVIGCVSTEKTVVRGCRVAPLGAMVYRLLGTEAFMRRWFPDGFTREAVARAPAVIYNAKDRLHHSFCEKIHGDCPDNMPLHVVPRPEQLFQLIVDGFAYGMVPDWQSNASRRRGRLVEVCPDDPHRVRLYWHCWNLAAEPLQRLSDRVVGVAATLLDGPVGSD